MRAPLREFRMPCARRGPWPHPACGAGRGVAPVDAGSFRSELPDEIRAWVVDALPVDEPLVFPGYLSQPGDLTFECLDAFVRRRVITTRSRHTAPFTNHERQLCKVADTARL